MQIGISIMLSFSVFKLRLSDDVPVQSDYIPLINVYFTLCMSISLFAMIWFSIIQILKERKKLKLAIINAINLFVFIVFFLFAFCLNFLGLYIFPFYLKEPLVFED